MNPAKTKVRRRSESLNAGATPAAASNQLKGKNMKLIIDTHSKDLCIELGTDTAALLGAIGKAFVVKSHYDSKRNRTVYAKSTEQDGSPVRIEMRLIDDSEFIEPSPAIDQLTTALKESDKRWIEYYNRATKAENELNELKKKLDGSRPDTTPDKQ